MDILGIDIYYELQNILYIVFILLYEIFFLYINIIYNRNM